MTKKFLYTWKKFGLNEEQAAGIRGRDVLGLICAGGKRLLPRNSPASSASNMQDIGALQTGMTVDEFKANLPTPEPTHQTPPKFSREHSWQNCRHAHHVARSSDRRRDRENPAAGRLLGPFGWLHSPCGNGLTRSNQMLVVVLTTITA